MRDLPDKEFMTNAEYCEWMGITENNAAVQRHEGKGPPYLKLHKKKIVYRVEDIREWMNEKIVYPGRGAA